MGESGYGGICRQYFIGDRYKSCLIIATVITVSTVVSDDEKHRSSD